MSPRRIAISAAAVAVLLLAGIGAVVAVRSGGTDSGGANPQAAARTSFTDLQPASDAPTLPSLTSLQPAPGQVVEAAGPFDDRFHFSRLRFDGTAVRGVATITSDVSDILEFEALAGFYDRRGILLGTARYIHHLDTHGAEDGHEGPPNQTQRFSIRVPAALKGAAVSAAVGVPVLVNE